MRLPRPAARVDIRKDIGSRDDMHTHIGLINVDRRIKMYYGAGYGLYISSVKGEGTCVRAVLPALTSAPETAAVHRAEQGTVKAKVKRNIGS